MSALAICCGLLLATSPAGASGTPPTSLAPDGWCPPSGPNIDKHQPADNNLMLGSGWVTLRMRVHPGAVPVSEVRVVSEAGGPGHARVHLPLVRQWIGCATNPHETLYDVRFNFGIEGHYQLPEQEGFGLYAFKAPQGAPALPPGSMGVGVCPIRAQLQLNQPQSPNLVIQLDSSGGAAVSEWLQQLVANRDYMEPNLGGNRVLFPCRVDDGQLNFFEK